MLSPRKVGKAFKKAVAVVGFALHPQKVDLLAKRGERKRRRRRRISHEWEFGISLFEAPLLSLTDATAFLEMRHMRCASDATGEKSSILPLPSGDA
jgi:hypothetical protein